MTTHHLGKTLPSTYDRGHKCLDIIAMSNTIDNRAIIKCGIMPFYHGMPSDHRSFYVDFDIDHLFTNAYTDTYYMMKNSEIHIIDIISKLTNTSWCIKNIIIVIVQLVLMINIHLSLFEYIFLL